MQYVYIERVLDRRKQDEAVQLISTLHQHCPLITSPLYTWQKESNFWEEGKRKNQVDRQVKKPLACFFHAISCSVYIFSLFSTADVFREKRLLIGLYIIIKTMYLGLGIENKKV